jgi:hypothetical protein
MLSNSTCLIFPDPGLAAIPWTDDASEIASAAPTRNNPFAFIVHLLELFSQPKIAQVLRHDEN